MDQTGYPGVDETTILLALEGKSPPPVEGEHPGVGTASLAPTTTAGLGKMKREGAVKKK